MHGLRGADVVESAFRLFGHREAVVVASKREGKEGRAHVLDFARSTARSAVSILCDPNLFTKKQMKGFILLTLSSEGNIRALAGRRS